MPHSQCAGHVLWFGADGSGFLVLQSLTNYAHSKAVTDVKFNKTGTLAASVSEDGFAKVFDTSTCATAAIHAHVTQRS